MRVALDVLNYW